MLHQLPEEFESTPQTFSAHDSELQTWLPVAGAAKSTRVVSQTDTEDYGLCRQSWHVVYQKCKSRTLSGEKATTAQQLCVDGCLASARQRPRPCHIDSIFNWDCNCNCIVAWHPTRANKGNNRQISTQTCGFEGIRGVATCVVRVSYKQL